MSVKVGNEMDRSRTFCFRLNKMFGQVHVEGEVRRLLMFIFIPRLLSILVWKLKYPL